VQLNGGICGFVPEKFWFHKFILQFWIVSITSQCCKQVIITVLAGNSFDNGYFQFEIKTKSNYSFWIAVACQPGFKYLTFPFSPQIQCVILPSGDSITQFYFLPILIDYWSLYQVGSGASPTGYMRLIACHKNYCGFSLSVPNLVHHFWPKF
jgi:hypothetical protein